MNDPETSLESFMYPYFEQQQLNPRLIGPFMLHLKHMSPH